MTSEAATTQSHLTALHSVWDFQAALMPCLLLVAALWRVSWNLEQAAIVRGSLLLLLHGLNVCGSQLRQDEQAVYPLLQL